VAGKKLGGAKPTTCAFDIPASGAAGVKVAPAAGPHLFSLPALSFHDLIPLALLKILLEIEFSNRFQGSYNNLPTSLKVQDHDLHSVLP
jgi:hypothetical protein